MREFSKVSPTVWRSRKFKSLTDLETKFVYFYILTSPHNNSAGCYDLHPLYASADIGLSEIQYLNSIDTLSKANLIEFDKDENTVMVINWESFNEPMNPKHALGLLYQLNQASSMRLKAIVFNKFLKIFKAKGFDNNQALANAIDTLSIEYRYHIPTETETKIETESRPDPDNTFTETREKSSRNGKAAIAEGHGGLPLKEGAVNRLLETPLMKRQQKGTQ